MTRPVFDPPPDPTPTSPVGVRRPTVLVVEPDPISRHVLERALTMSGCRSECTETLAGALEILQRDAIDMVIAEAMTDDADGPTMLRRVREACGPGAPRILFVTAGDSSSMRAALLRGGAVDVVSKPFSNDELGARVARALDLDRGRAPELGAAVLAGDVAGARFANLLSMLEMERATGLLDIAAGVATGRMALRGGRIVDATFGNLTGMPALLVLLQSERCHFRYFDDVAPDRERLSQSITELLMDAAVKEDDARRDGVVPSTDDRLRALGISRQPIALRRARRTSGVVNRASRREVGNLILAALDDGYLLGDFVTAEPPRSTSSTHELVVELWTSLEDAAAAMLELASPLGFAVLVAAMRGELRELCLRMEAAKGASLLLRFRDVVAAPADTDRGVRAPDGVILAPPRGELLSLHPGRLAELADLAAQPEPPAMVSIGGPGLNRTARELFLRGDGRGWCSLAAGVEGVRGRLREAAISAASMWCDA